MKNILCLIFLFISTLLAADNIKLTQIDARALFLNQRVTAYLSATDSSGNPVKDFSPSELSAKDANGNILAIEETIVGGNQEEGVSFFLLVDNSGSMYDEILFDRKRIDAARDALKSFLGKPFKTEDRIALTEFNTLVNPVKAFDDPLSSDPDALSAKISRPERDMAYTELYGALEKSLAELGKYTGRKALIVLSDGEDFPYFERTGDPHPVWGKQQFLPEDTLRRARLEGITVYAINLGNDKDPGLQEIAVKTGGTVYDPKDGHDLAYVYEDIKRRIEQEIKIVFRPEVADGGWDSVEFSYRGSRSSGGFNTPSLLGARSYLSSPVLLLIFLAGILLYVVLALLKYEKTVKSAQVELFSGGTSPQSTVFLQNQATVIGSTGDLTVAGNPNMKDSHATIMRDERTGQFTLVSDTEVYVNNRPTKKKKLAAGDVVQIEGSTIFFDEPDIKKKK